MNTIQTFDNQGLVLREKIMELDIKASNVSLRARINEGRMNNTLFVRHLTQKSKRRRGQTPVSVRGSLKNARKCH